MPGTETRVVSVGDVTVGDGVSLAFIGGPCVIEDEAETLRVAHAAAEIAAREGFGFIFKSSYSKENRGSAEGFRGPGLEEGLRILARVRREVGVPVLSDVHCQNEVGPAAEVLDVLQIPAYLCQQTGLVLAAGRTGRVINVKKGQFLAPESMKSVVGKLESTGNRRVLLTERGSCFGYGRLVADFRSLPIMRALGYPVVFDATHVVRLYGTPSSDPRGGEAQFIPALARAAVAVGCDAVFLEVHPEPSRALCDASSQLPLDRLAGVLRELAAVQAALRAVRQAPPGGPHE